VHNATKHIRHGVGSVRPYLYGRLDMLELVKRAFGAVGLERLEAGKRGFHVEAKIGDSMVVMEVSDPPHPGGKPASIYVYIDDVDAAYQRALASGATSIAAPEDKPYQERAAGVKDSFGNTWWIATYTG
jgi:PhnB protein